MALTKRFEFEIDRVGRIHQDEMNFPISAVDVFRAQEVFVKMAVGQTISIDSMQCVQKRANLFDIPGIIRVPIISAVLKKLVEFLRACGHFRRVVDKGKAKIYPSLVYFYEGAL